MYRYVHAQGEQVGSPGRSRGGTEPFDSLLKSIDPINQQGQDRVVLQHPRLQHPLIRSMRLPRFPRTCQQRNVPTEASVARAAGHIFADAAAGVGSAQPGFYGDCCAPAYRAGVATTFYRALSP
eukprot:COSAG06_NODE_1075_length_10809_cov_5.838375_8_plen_124_part_00